MGVLDGVVALADEASEAGDLVGDGGIAEFFVEFVKGDAGGSGEVVDGEVGIVVELDDAFVGFGEFSEGRGVVVCGRHHVDETTPAFWVGKREGGHDWKVARAGG